MQNPVGAARTAGCDVTPTQSLPALGTNQIQPAEIIALAQRMLLAIRAIDWEELRRHNSTTILKDSQRRRMVSRATYHALEATEMINSS